MKHRGIALVMGLLLLAGISLMALMTANGMTLQRRMSANFTDAGRSLAEADAASAAAQAWLYSRPDSERERGCLAGCTLPVAIWGPGQLPRNPEFESAAWWQDNGIAAGSHPQTGEPLGFDTWGADPPRWIIEELLYLPLEADSTEPAIDGIGHYRIYARAGGRSPGSVAITEAVLARPWEGEFEPLPYPAKGPPGLFCHQFDAAIPCGMQAWRQRR